MKTQTHTQHTPGPWKAVHSGYGDANVEAHCGWKFKDASPFTPLIAARLSWPDARLIAAAPELLHALECCQSILYRMGPPPIQRGTLCEEQDYARSMLLAARAIAKATGKACHE